MGCACGKVGYLDRARADQHMAELRKDVREHPSRLKRLNVYFSARCGVWHVGHHRTPKQRETHKRRRHHR